MSDISSDETIEVIIRAGSTSNNELEVNTDGSLNTRGNYSSGNDILNSNYDFLDISTLGYSEVIVHVTGTFSGTITPFLSVNGSQLIATTALSQTGIVSAITSTGFYRIRCVSAYKLELLASPWSSGSATVYWIATQSNGGTDILTWLGSTSPSIGQKTMASSLPVVVASDQTALPVTVSAYGAGTIYSTQATYNPPTTGNQASPLVAAVVGKKIRVYTYAVSLAVSSANTYLRDGTAGSQLSVLWLRATGGSVPTFYTQTASESTYLFETSSGNALITNCSTNTGVISIQISYSLV